MTDTKVEKTKLTRAEKINILLEEWEDVSIEFPKTEWVITKAYSSRRKQKNIKINNEEFIAIPLYQICLKKVK